MKPSSLHIPKDLLPKKNQTLFLGVSGGLDSMTLLHVCLQENLHPVVLHVNYRLRGEDSDADETLVRNYCQLHDIECHVYQLTDDQREDLLTGNLQEKARNIRYDFFYEKMKNSKAVLMTAHHADDQIETFFLRLFRQAGLRGLQGMLPVNGSILRPFLSFSKKDIQQYAEQNQLVWREDKSNASTKYLRNKLRLNWLPEMEKEVPKLREQVLILMEAFQQENQYFQMKFAKKANIMRETRKWNYTDFDVLTRDEIYWLGQSIGFQANEINQLIRNRNSMNSSMVQTQFMGEVCKTREGWSWRQESSIEPILQTSLCSILPETFTKEVLFLDTTKLVGPLRVRLIEKGDRIASVGMKGTQLVSKILKDAKLEKEDKLRTWIVCDDQNVHWVHGLKVGRLALATEYSTQITKVELIFAD